MIIVQNWKFIVLKLLANQFIEHLILSLGLPLTAEANVIQKLLFGDWVRGEHFDLILNIIIQYRIFRSRTQDRARLIAKFIVYFIAGWHHITKLVPVVFFRID